jgi:hypothetical protein
MAKDNGVGRFMRATGRLRAVFGPAARTDIDHEMTAENKALLASQAQQAQQWETVTRPDGSTYVVPKDPEDKSLR